MDSGTGHIYEATELKTVNVKGKIVMWKVDEYVIVKGCKFKVKEIKQFPVDEITLVGVPRVLDELTEKVFNDFNDVKTSSQAMRDFIRNKK